MLGSTLSTIGINIFQWCSHRGLGTRSRRAWRAHGGRREKFHQYPRSTAGKRNHPLVAAFATCERSCMVTGRRFVLVLGAGALTPYSSFAQQTKVRRVGFLSLDTARSDAGQSALEQFPAALAKLGYVEGRNLVIEWRWADGRTGDLRELAAGLVRGGMDVIVSRTNDPIRAAKDATR